MTRSQRIGFAAGILFGWTLFFASQVALASESKRVLLLYYSFGGNLVNATHFRAALERQSPNLLEIYDAPLNAARPADEDVVSRYADYLQALFPDQRLDLVVAIGASAVRLSQRYRRQHFPSTPILAIAEARRVTTADLAENDVLIASDIDLSTVIGNILGVLPDTKNVAVVIGNSANERFWLDQTRRASEPFASRVSFTYFNDLSFDEMLYRAGMLPPKSAILHLMLLTDAAGTTHDDSKIVPKLHAGANAPIFSYYDINFGNGIVGGPLISVEDRSRVAAGIALRILDGERPRDIKTPVIGLAAPKFDWREMQQWGITESRLPPGSVIHFRNPTAWEQHRNRILAIVAALLVQTALISWLMYEHRRRTRAEIIARHSMAELTHMNRIAAAGELSASIAHEINQPLTGIVTKAAAARRWLRAQNPDLAKVQAMLNQIEAAAHRTAEIITSVKSMFRKDTQTKEEVDIRDLIWKVLGLVFIDLRKHQIELITVLDEQLPTVFGNRGQLQQVILNLITNAIDAMNAVQTRVLFVGAKLNERGLVQISIEDTGIGIDASILSEIFKPLFTTKERGMGMGLSICRSIVEGHDGRIWASPAKNRGTVFEFELPTKVTQANHATKAA
jgi:signal transduction histidine kinase